MCRSTVQGPSAAASVDQARRSAFSSRASNWPGKNQRVRRAVSAADIVQHMRKIGLKAELRVRHPREELHHQRHALHSAPAAFAFRGEDFAEPAGDVAGLAESVGDRRGVGLLVARKPLLDRCRGVNADNARVSDTSVAKLLGDAAALAHLGEEGCAFCGIAHGRTAARSLPHRRDNRADLQAHAPDHLGDSLDFGGARINRHMRVGEEEVHAVESLAVNVGPGDELQHVREPDWRLTVRAFAHKAGPNSNVQSREIVRLRHPTTFHAGELSPLA